MQTWDEFYRRPKAPSVAAGRYLFGLLRGAECERLVIACPEERNEQDYALEFSLNKAEALALRNFLNEVLPPENRTTPGGASIVSSCEARSCTAEPTSASAETAEAIMAEDLSRQRATPQEMQDGTKAAMDKLFPPPGAAPAPAADAAAPGDEEVPEEAPPAEGEPPAGETSYGAKLLVEIAGLVDAFGDWAVTMPIFVNRHISEKDLAEGRVPGKVMLEIRDELKAMWEKRQEAIKKADAKGAVYAKRSKKNK